MTKVELIRKILDFEVDGWDLETVINMARAFRFEELKSMNKEYLQTYAKEDCGLEFI